MRGCLELPKPSRDTYNHRPSLRPLAPPRHSTVRATTGPHARPGLCRPSPHRCGASWWRRGVLTAKVVAARRCGGIILLFGWGGEGGARKGEGGCEDVDLHYRNRG